MSPAKRVSSGLIALLILSLLVALTPPIAGVTRDAGATQMHYDVVEKSITELQAAMTAGEVTSEALVQAYLDRIQAYDQHGPAINAMVYINPNAIADARALDQERATKGPRGPLHGIPAIIKDNFDTKDMPTTGGLVALAGSVPPDDAFQVAKLREAGAVFLGKANMPDTAFTFYNLSSIGGQSLSPYDTRRAASGGSSSAAAAALTSNFAAFITGSDTCGSIRGPANYNSVVGLRPTHGLSSRDGVMPISHSADAAGPLARNMRDLAILLDVTMGYDPQDPASAASIGRIPSTYTSSLEEGALAGARIGVLNVYFETPPLEDDYIAVARQALTDMGMHGASLVDVTIPDFATLVANANVPFTAEFREDFNAYLAQRDAPIGSLEELLASGLYHANINNAIQNTLEGAQANQDLNTPLYASRVQGRQLLKQVLVQTMDESGLDAIVYPYAKVRPAFVGTPQAGINCTLSPYSELPALTVPAGFTADGIPVGIEFLGRPFDEPRLIALGYAYEQHTQHRRPPATTPQLLGPVSNAPPVSVDFRVPGGVEFPATATAEQASPPSGVLFSASGTFVFNESTRELGYFITVSGAAPTSITGAYIHRRSTRPNGPIVWVLEKEGFTQTTGVVTLTESQVIDLKEGNLYFTVLSRDLPPRPAKGSLVLPSE
jgi:Asp-tRNA(Asn)/Glu-tRNA(Gln) amidotransferase A subunit family amidase